MRTCTGCTSNESRPNWYSSSLGPICHRCYGKACRLDNPAKYKKLGVAQRAKNPEAHKAGFKRWLENNKEKNTERVRLWVANNRERMRELDRARYQRDKAKRIMACRAREAGLKDSTPKWLTAEHRQQMQDAYTFRHPAYHVDHIVPLKGKNVCGLNVPWNLQYLLASDNLKKSNKF